MKNHIRVVHEGEQFPCKEDGCLQKFSSRRTLANHRRKVHGVQVGKKAGDSDKQVKKRAIAALLSNMEIDAKEEKMLLMDKETSLNAKDINDTIVNNKAILKSMQEETTTDDYGDATASLICARPFCNNK